MPLEMKRNCECCGKRLFKNSEEVYICSFESTYCKECTEAKNFVCTACSGKLEKRPKRIITEIKVIPLENVLGIVYTHR